MSFDSSRLAQIVAKVNAAVLEPARWSDALDDAARCLGANGAALFSLGEKPGFKPFGSASGAVADSIDVYRSDWQSRDAWIEAAAREKRFERAGEVEVAQSVLPVSSLRRTAFHSDFLRVADIEDIVSLKVFGEGDGRAPAMHLSFFRPPGQPLFERSDTRLLHGLWPHLQRALQAHFLLHQAQEAQRWAESAIDGLPQLVWVLRQSGQIDFANRAAVQAMANADWLVIRNEHLHRIGDLDEGAIHLALCSARHGGGRNWIAAIEFEGRLRRAMLHVVPLETASAYAWRWPHATALLMLQLPASTRWDAQWHQRLAEKYQLTPAELRVLCLLGDGLPPKAIAAQQGVSAETVRSHLRALYEKTGCRRQSALMRLMNA
jgi:DNA-binding CsgD family transcriptional regulator